MTEIQKYDLIKRMENDVEFLKKYELGMEDAYWNDEIGVLISGNEALEFIKYLKLSINYIKGD